MYETIMSSITKELNEPRVYDEISKVKAILIRQINELKAFWKSEFNSREKADIELLMSIEKLKEIFQEKINNEVKLSL